MDSREEKFKSYREEIARADKNKEEIIETITQEDLDQQEENHLKKNTLTMSIDQIIEAHDEYTMIIQQKQLADKIRQEKKEKRILKTKKILKYIGIGLLLVLIVAVIAIVIMKIWK